jgi:hypothetical protein
MGANFSCCKQTQEEKQILDLNQQNESTAISKSKSKNVNNKMNTEVNENLSN